MNERDDIQKFIAPIFYTFLIASPFLILCFAAYIDRHYTAARIEMLIEGAVMIFIGKSWRNEGKIQPDDRDSLLAILLIGMFVFVSMIFTIDHNIFFVEQKHHLACDPYSRLSTVASCVRPATIGMPIAILILNAIVGLIMVFLGIKRILPVKCKFQARRYAMALLVVGLFSFAPSVQMVLTKTM